MNTYNLNAVNRKEEEKVIKHILSKNKYDVSLVKRLAKTKKNEKQLPTTK
jgi:hypothetical protein